MTSYLCIILINPILYSLWKYENLSIVLIISSEWIM